MRASASGEKQLVEIVKALGKNSRILILDEPTAALAEHEVQILLDILRDLRARGIACIYISHKLDEVFAIADRITVLRDGATVGHARRCGDDQSRGHPPHGRARNHATFFRAALS